MSGVADQLRALAEYRGFESVGSCNADALVAREEVRAMCASDRCRSYGTNWACPPHCGSLDEFADLFASKGLCFAVQTVGRLDDEFDVESMAAAERLHSERFRALCRDVTRVVGDAAFFGAGPCTVCGACSCPDASCRRPEKRLVSMEAAGLVVGDVCISCGIPYNHGPRTIAYTSCILV